MRGIDIGGDWYDVIDLGGGRALVVVGDVSGRGLRAATIMARLRHAIQAYAAQGDPPALLVSKLSNLLSVERDGHFATALCAKVDVAARRVSAVNAGPSSPSSCARVAPSARSATIPVRPLVWPPARITPRPPWTSLPVRPCSPARTG